ncbi:uncharacterized protein TNCV_4170331 [Trichonephila clavipes]|nr:uncharacterized protein TNCV_4170331 [Trichonephila clavipes]
MEAIVSEAASGTSSAHEAARRLGLPPSSVRNILRRILKVYPCKLPSCHELLPTDTAQREAFAKWAFSKMEQDPTWVFKILWTDVAHFSLHGDVNNNNCRIWVTSNPLPSKWMDNGNSKCSALSNASVGDFRAMFNSTSPSSLSELKDAIRREVSSIHPDMLHSAVAEFVTRLECLLPCGGGHVEHILV